MQLTLEERRFRKTKELGGCDPSSLAPTLLKPLKTADKLPSMLFHHKHMDYMDYLMDSQIRYTYSKTIV